MTEVHRVPMQPELGPNRTQFLIFEGVHYSWEFRVNQYCGSDFNKNGVILTITRLADSQVLLRTKIEEKSGYAAFNYAHLVVFFIICLYWDMLDPFIWIYGLDDLLEDS